MTYPLVSVLLPTQDRPEWLAVALRCYAEQDYPSRELLVLDDGAEHPVDEAAVAAVGGRVLRFDASLSLGAELNAGARAASGLLLQKWDDDDIYGPGFLSAHVDRFRIDPGGFDAPLVVGCDRYLLTTLVDRRFWERKPGTICGATCIPRHLWHATPYPEDLVSGTVREHIRALAAAGARRRPIDGHDHLLVVRRDGLAGLPPHIDTGDASRPFLDRLPVNHNRVNGRRWSTDLPDWVRQHFERQRWHSARAPQVSVILRATTPSATSAALRDIAAQHMRAHEVLVYTDDPTTPLDDAAITAAGGRIVTPVALDPAARLDAVVAEATGDPVLLWPDALWTGPTALTEHVDALVARHLPSRMHPVVGYHQHRVYLPAREQLFRATTTPFASFCASRAMLAAHRLSTFATASPAQWSSDLADLTRPLGNSTSLVAAPPAAILGDGPDASAALVAWLAACPVDTSATLDEALPADVIATLPRAHRPIGDPTWRPLVTALVPTRDRPDLLATTLRAFAEQDYPNRELLVLDDGVEHPVDETLVAAAGGRVIRCPPGITLGAKLNIGAAAARGEIFLKMDDDDYFAPGFIAAHVREWREHPLGLDAPIVAGCNHFPLLIIADWTVIRRTHPRITGIFAIARHLWEQVPYPIVHGNGTDTAFFERALAIGYHYARIDGRDLMVVTRRDGIPGVSQHTFQAYRDQPVAAYLAERSDPDPRPIESLAPDWALAPLLAMRATLPTRPDTPSATPPPVADGLSFTGAHSARADVDGPGGHAP